MELAARKQRAAGRIGHGNFSRRDDEPALPAGRTPRRHRGSINLTPRDGSPTLRPRAMLGMRMRMLDRTRDDISRLVDSARRVAGDVLRRKGHVPREVRNRASMTKVGGGWVRECLS